MSRAPEQILVKSPPEWRAFLWVAFKFGLVGLGSIGVYFLVLILLRPWIANIVWLTGTCYVASAVINYALQRGFTFNAARPKAGSWLRYIGQHAICLSLNSGLMFVLVTTLGFNLLPSQLFVTVFIAGTSFMLSYLWVYK